MSKTATKKPKAAAAPAVPLYKKYGHISDSSENSSAEERFVATRFKEIHPAFAVVDSPPLEVSVSVPQPPQLPSPSEVTVDKKEQMSHFHPEIVANMAGFLQWIVFGIYFDESALEAPDSDEGAEMTPEYRRDKAMAIDAQGKALAFARFIKSHQELCFRRLRDKAFKPKTPLKSFYMALLDNPCLMRAELKTAPKGAFNIWNNEQFRADVACSQLTLVLGGGGEKATAQSISVYMQRDQADFMVMCHTLFHFASYAQGAAHDTAPDSVTAGALNFFNTWELLTGGTNHAGIDHWTWNGSTPFVKMVVQLRDTLQATLDWIH